jgi:pilus assembly protein Flp/PilA
MMALYTRLLLTMRGQSGQGLVEYGLVLVLVSVAVIGALMALSGQINTVYDNIVSGLQGSNP